MRRTTITAFVLAAVALTSTGTTAQDAKKESPAKEPAVKLKGFLPMNWGRIGLSDDQKQEVYKIQAKYGDEIEKHEAKIRELKAARQKDMEKVLSAEQKKKLLDILTGKLGAE